jgi:mannose-6-phosphate isomerase-like protein (cupin superfamily)
MKKAIGFSILGGVLLVPLTTQAQAAVDHISKAEILEKAKSLEAPATAAGGQAAITLAKYPHHYTMISLRQKDGAAEVHRNFADFFCILRGEATLITGGTVVAPKELSPGEIKGTSIEAGTQVTLHEGDFVHIPANVPHQVLLPKGGDFVYYVIKVQEN